MDEALPRSAPPEQAPNVIATTSGTIVEKARSDIVAIDVSALVATVYTFVDIIVDYVLLQLDRPAALSRRRSRMRLLSNRDRVI